MREYRSVDEHVVDGATVNPSLTSVLVGDELGLLKRIDLHSTPSISNVVTLNRDLLDGEPSPDKSILSIRPFKSTTYADDGEDNEDEDEDSADTNDESDNLEDRLRVIRTQSFDPAVLFLVASKPSNLMVYNSLTHQITNAKAVQSEFSLVGAEPINRNNVALFYDNGTIDVHNVDKALLDASAEGRKKAIRLLGLDLGEETTQDSPKSDASGSSQGKAKSNISSKAKSLTGTSSGSSEASSSSSSHPLASNIFSPNWNTSNTSLTCFKVCGSRVAVGGKNVDLKIFDLNTKQCIFTAKSAGRDWLGLKQPIWVSDVEWIGPIAKLSSSPSMVATCSRTEPVVKVYDLKANQRKPVMTMNLKDSTFNNDSNPPSFTSLCSTATPHNTSLPTQQLILGTTMGRMMAVDVRFNSHSYRHLGVFKSYGGGAIRDIKYVPQSSTTSKIISCSLDRFVRVHSFILGADKKRQLDSKYYIKTKPTCVQPICTNFVVSNESDDVAHIDDSDLENSDN